VEQGGTQAGQQDALRTAQREIEGVREIMTENIERVLERGEHMSVLVDKTGRLGENARDFRVRSRTLKRRMWWKNVKLMVLLTLVVIFLIYLFVGFGCGLPGKFPVDGRNPCALSLLHATELARVLATPRAPGGYITKVSVISVYPPASCRW